MPVYPIPSDWDGEDWACLIVEWPNSVEWLGILRGLITTPTRGRFWDSQTGTITEAQAIGLEIEERNPVSSCDEIVAQLTAIATAVENLDVSQDLQVAIQTNIENNINLVATAVSTSLATQTSLLVASSVASSVANANAFAWAEAIAQNTTGIQIINNTEIQFRPIAVGIDQPPTATEETPTGITSATESTTPSEICKRAYWLVRGLKELLNYMAHIESSVAKSVLGLAGALADATWTAAFTGGTNGRRFIMPIANFLSAAHQLQEVIADGLDPFQDLSDWIDSEYEGIVCFLAEGVTDEDTTEQLQAVVVASLTSFAVNPRFFFLPLLVMNFSSLAALYFVSPLLDIAPAIPAFERADICTFCGG